MNYLTRLIFFLCLLKMGKTAPMTKNDAMEYLGEFGYMENQTESEAIKTFQNNFDLPETGMLDAATIHQMEQPRCGRPDGLEFKSNSYVWTKNYITYTIKNGPVSGSLSRQNVEDELRESFKMWEQHIPVTFEHDPERGDIEIRFNDPRTGGKSDGNGKTLAYAYFPEKGDIYFDRENWSLDSRTGFKFRAVATHEIGHSLGLKHSKNRKALMHPFYKKLPPGWTLPEPDIVDIKALYNKDHICEYGKIDGIFDYSDNSIMVVKGRYCWKFDENTLAENYPKLCEKIWSRFPSKFDAIFSDNKKLYFFSDKVLFSLGTRSNRKIDINLENVKKIDTVLIVENRLYIFEDRKYWSFIKKNNGWSRKGGSRLIADFWKGVPSNLDAAIFNSVKHINFFKNADVYRFNIETKRMVGTTFSINELLTC